MLEHLFSLEKHLNKKPYKLNKAQLNFHNDFQPF